MSKIDFSKAPKGATHYRSGVSDTTLWYKKDPTINPIGYHWVWWCDAIEEWSSCGVGAIEEATKITKQLTVTCDNERQKMLCEQVIRMDKGEFSEVLINSEYHYGWVDASHMSLSIDLEYRAKPKKELVVPWEFIPDDVTHIEVSYHKAIFFYFGDESEINELIKLDLTDIELPVTVERPKC